MHGIKNQKIERNVRRCTFNRYSVITRFAKLAAGEQLCRRSNQLYSTSNPLEFSPEKLHILSCDTLVANGRLFYFILISVDMIFTFVAGNQLK